ncbi:MAG: hypothetical protein LW838_02295 [Nitrosomonadaceae bacterium]|jgi:hypothetical protein|nr:hypothetical protein [Nitrosomonadaceae bacterium]
MTQAQIEKMFSIAMGSDIIEFVESLEKQAAIDALKKAERMEEVERKETIPTMDFHGWQINLKPTAHPYAGTMEFVAVNDGEMKSSDSLDELIDEVYEHYYGL